MEKRGVEGRCVTFFSVLNIQGKAGGEQILQFFVKYKRPLLKAQLHHHMANK
jgi:hypothetical protein